MKPIERLFAGATRLVGRSIRLLSLGLFLSSDLATAATADGASQPAIHSVSLSRPFFNPTLGQKIEISLSSDHAGSLTAVVLDRDGFLVREIASERPVKRGPVLLSWDGRDGHGRIVPDEAYSLKFDLSVGTRRETYFPGNAPGHEVTVGANYYDRRGGVLSYRLERPARVHIQAGVATLDPKTGKRDGPVYKTLANREPRPAGAVIENWNGFDESGSFHVPSRPNFVVAIAATALPENAILTIGNRKEEFLERALSRRGASLFTFSTKDHHHHRGLSALDDVAPRLRVTPLNAVWSASQQSWLTTAKVLKVSLELEGRSAESFARQRSKLLVFLNQDKRKEILQPSRGLRLELELHSRSPEPQIVAFNWASAFGPVAVNNLRVSRGRTPSAARASSRNP